MRRRAVTLVLLLLGSLPTWVGAQGYRLRLDSRLQHATYRGTQVDSVLLADVITGPDGGLLSPDGVAVSCSAAAWCYLWRPGAEQAGTPWVTTLDGSVWGLGITGLSLRGNVRLIADFSDDRAWPATTPPAQLVEGYAEYARRWLTARVGRQFVTGRLGSTGLDGARATVRHRPLGLEIGGYAGWSLARGSAIPLTSEAANPLGEYRPTDRLVVAGGHAGWRSAWADVRAEYEREVDPGINKFSSERLAVSVAARPVSRIALTAGGEYDLAFGHWGSADASVRWISPRLELTAGARRYMPFFPLWTIWGAFSPVAHHGGYAALQARPLPKLRLRARYDRYAYEDAEAETPLVDASDNGWRASFGGGYALVPALVLDMDVHAEKGPGANSSGWRASATWNPSDRLSVMGFGGSDFRPLEYRYSDSRASFYGADMSWSPRPVVQLGLGLARYDEERDRPDAAALDWSQTRLTARFTWFLDAGGADRVRRPVGGGT